MGREPGQGFEGCTPCCAAEGEGEREGEGEGFSPALAGTSIYYTDESSSAVLHINHGQHLLYPGQLGKATWQGLRIVCVGPCDAGFQKEDRRRLVAEMIGHSAAAKMIFDEMAVQLRKGARIKCDQGDEEEEKKQGGGGDSKDEEKPWPAGLCKELRENARPNS